MPYTIEFHNAALRNLANLSKKECSRIIEAIEQLAPDPLHAPNVKRLKEYDVSYRMRVGNFRVLFDRDDSIQIISIVDVRDRKSAYKRK